jgi:hypothetical protein
MKKILVLASLLLLISASHGQTTMTQTDPAGASASVNTNADTSYHTLDLAGNVYNYRHITIAVAGTKTSGTVAGACVPYGSLDGSRWFPLYGRTPALMGADTTSSQSLSNGDNDIAWHFDYSRWRYYRVRVITSGTQVSSYVVRLQGRKEPTAPN